LFPLKRFVWAGYAGLSAYLLVSAAYSAGVVSDLIEYLYLGYLAQTVSASSALTASLHALNRLVEIRVNSVPVARCCRGLGTGRCHSGLFGWSGFAVWASVLPPDGGWFFLLRFHFIFLWCFR
jgi:hypothetical protein